MIRDIYIKGYSGSTPPPAPAGWTRPADWLTMPTLTSADEEIAILHAVWNNDSNYAAFQCTTSAGDYDVDWGDGTTTSHASNTTAEHQYDYATYDTGNATLSTRGYKQAIIRITPATGTLATFSSNFRYTGQNQAYSTGFLDVLLSMPSATSGQSILFQSTSVSNRYMERVHILNSGGITSALNMFQSCLALQSVPLFDTSSVTTMSTIFANCNSLQSVPLFNTSSVTTMVSMFSGCTLLQSVPLFDTSSVTNMGAMFLNCNSLQEIPTFVTTSVTTMTNFANNCLSMSKTDMVCPVSVVFLNNQLSQAGLVNIFNNLLDRTLLAAANINITGNYGAAALTVPERAIATLKNWTITG
jgi:surface protein